ncbi:nuclear transport factor 2 family protein, partial [Algoriphagus persicinus]|uniref:nuclear transport factor 2 family protein n=1 Tax=Algoriphagus persicinus TaxID=3108754 RepID=UPI003A5CD7AF
MESEKRKLLDSTHQAVLEMGIGGKMTVPLSEIVSTEIVGIGTAIDEKIFGIHEVEELLKRQKEQTEGIEVDWNFNMLDIHISPDENTAVIIDDIFLKIKTDQELEMYLRFSIVFEYVGDKWVLIHWHSSKPEQVKSEKDTWGIASWKEKAESLEKEVAERTSDLVVKIRELEIEEALERVRSRSMAMHKSEDLKDVIQVVFEQLLQLNFKADSASFVVDFKSKDDFYFWSANSQLTYPILLHMPYIDNPIYNDAIKVKEKGLDFYSALYSFEEKNEFWQNLFDHSSIVPKDRQQYLLSTAGNATSTAIMDSISLMINNYHGDAFSDAENAILKRFGKVFEQAYTRFLDLQKAEAQAREAQIEVALEKVRSASMAMHKSEELVQVVRILDKQILGLGIEVEGTQIITDFADPEKGINDWLAVKGQDYLKKFHVPFIKHPNFKKLWTAVQKGTEFYTESYSKTEKNEFFKVLFENSDFSAIPKERQDYINNTPGYVRATSLSKNSILIFHRYVLKEFSKEEEEIFKRFGKVFEQAYTRFLDLQKAEAQAREAQIEVALEKVRSASMAMHKSEDLLLVIRAVHEQITELGIKVDASNFLTFIENSRDFYLWAITNTHTYQQKLRVTYIDFGMTKKLWDAWEKGDSFVELQADADEMHRWWNKAFEVSELRHTPPHRREIILSAPGHTSIVARKKTCALQLHRYNLERFTTQEHDILRRLASVFEQSYSRFLDLQKAENQAREAQIEVALEKVRSASMAMHKSEELIQVVRIIDKEIQGLGIETEGTQIITDFAEPEKGFNDWFAKEGHDFLEKFYIPYIEHSLTKNIYDAVAKGVDFYSDSYSKDEKIEFYKLLFEYSDFRTYPKESQDYLFNLPGLVRASVLSKNSILVFQRYDLKEFSKEEEEIFKRFGKVFEQSFVRFLDLQKAEAQAREAIKQSSLDRVRGEIASMRDAKDLERITPLVWKELQSLGVPFFRCGVMLVNEEEEVIDFYLSNPQGEALAALHLDFENSEITRNGVAHWRKKKTYIEHWDQQQFLAFMKTLMDQGQISNEAKYQGGAKPPEALTLQFVPFTQGMVYVGTEKDLSEEELDLVKVLGKSLSVAYARYEDFTKLDLAKAKAEKALNDLKAAQEQLVQQEKLASLGQLTAGIAHEIKNPLNFVNNFSEVSIELVDEAIEERS